MVLFVAVSWIGTIYLIPKIYGPPTEAGTFGDMFGSLNALFSGLAFIGVIVAILLQKSELELQRQELEETRGELRGQKVQLEEQNKTFRKQSFEGTFFQLLKLYNDLVNSTDIETKLSILPNSKTTVTTGRDSFVKLYTNFSSMVFQSVSKEKKEDSEIVLSNIIESSYEKFYEKYESDLSHYFRTIYNIIKFVDHSSIDNKKFYTNILRSQLSSHELLLLTYNCRSFHGCEKMLPYLKTYDLLKHLPKKELIESVYIKRKEKEEKEEKIKNEKETQQLNQADGI